MDMPKQYPEQMSLSSSDSFSEAVSEPQIKRLRIDDKRVEPDVELSSEDALLKEAQIYQDYMKRIPIPTKRGSVIPFTSWTELGTSIKQLYKQPLHYLTNVHLRQLDQLRIGAPDEDKPLDSLIPPLKAEINLWLMEEIHRLSSSSHHLAKLWLRDKLYRAYIDPTFLGQPGSSKGIVFL